MTPPAVKISATVGKAFIREHHYSRGSHNGPTCYGCFLEGALVGVVAFATPCSERVRASVFGVEHKAAVIELHRMVVTDDFRAAGFSLSAFAMSSIRALVRDRPQTGAVLTFADPTEGHHGGIYQACSMVYTGTSEAAVFYLDETGRLRHPRQGGVNITRAMAAARGWTPTKRQGKHRYVHLTGRKWRRMCLLQALPYVKPGVA